MLSADIHTVVNKGKKQYSNTLCFSKHFVWKPIFILTCRNLDCALHS